MTLTPRFKSFDATAVPMCCRALCAARGTLGYPVNLVHQWLGRLPASLVYINDSRDLGGGCGFATLGPDRDAAVAGLQRVVNDVGGKRIYALGVSRGGYAALYYGLALGAASVLSLSGPTDYTPAFMETLGPLSEPYRDLCARAPDYIGNLRDDYAAANHRPLVLLAYAAGEPRDRGHAQRMAGLPNVELVPVDATTHNVLEPLIKGRTFLPLLNRLLSAPA